MKSWKCDLCEEQVTELGTYVKLTLLRRAHLGCYRDALGAEVITSYEQRKADLAAERAEQEAKVRFASLPRCTRCGVKMGDPAGLGHRGTVHPPSSGGDVCAYCVRGEIKARASARQVAPPPSAAQAIQQAPSAPVAPSKAPEPEVTRDRFSLLDLD